MIKDNVEYLECSAQYTDLVERYRKLKKKIRRMRKSFAAIECAIIKKYDHHAEFIIGECEAYRGRHATL